MAHADQRPKIPARPRTTSGPEGPWAEYSTDAVDPRVSPELRATNDDIGEGLFRQLSDAVRHHGQHPTVPDAEKQPRSSTRPSSPDEKDTIYVDFEPGDSRNPANYTLRRKWVMTVSACLFTALSAASSSSYNQGFPSMTRELHTTSYIAGIGLSLYCLGFALVPLVTASLSEEFGRMPLYVVSAGGFALSHLMVALAPNIATVLAGRFLNGAFGSTGATMVGGSIADIWAPAERGFFMSVYSLSALASIGIGPVAAAWIEADPHLQWRWIQWIHFIVTGVYTLLIPVLMKETRSGVLLTRLAKKKRAETGDPRYRARAEDERGSLRALMWVSCTRPLYLLCTEPVVIVFSMWIGFAWGLLYGVIDSISSIFRQLHHFGTGAVGTVYICMTLGSLLGFSVWQVQERLYTRYQATRGPEARLHTACGAAVLFPAGMFVYAWCAYPSVPWIGLCVGIVMFMTAVFNIYCGVFSYLADCYGPFASSALAGQSLARNIMGTAFPLFTTQLYDGLGFRWGNTLFAFLAAVLAPVPYVLFFYGPKLRARSKFAGKVVHNN